MRLLWVVISSIFMVCCCGQLEDGNSNQFRCGLNKSCVPTCLCRQEEISMDGEPSRDPRNALDVCGPTSQCCHIDNQKRHFGFELPYLGSFPPNSFGVGKSIRIEGLILPQLPSSDFSQLFVVRLQSGQDFWPKPAIAFELSDYTTEEESRPKELSKSFTRENSFNLDIVRAETSYKVYVNKQLVVKIPVKVDEKIMDTLYVNGDIRLSDVVVENFSPTIQPAKEPYLFKDIGVIKEGVSFIVTGYMLPSCERFEINLMTAADDIALHVNPRPHFGVIVFNSLVNNTWADPGHLEYKMPSSLGQDSKFTIEILVTEKCYMIAVNGRHVFEFKHRLPYTSVSDVEVDGGIDRVEFKRIEVSKYPQRLREFSVQNIWVATD